MGTGEHGLTRGTCFVGRRFEVAAVAGRLWVSWCVLGCGGISLFFVFFFPSNAHGLLQVPGMRPSCLIFLSTSKILFPTGVQSHQAPGMHLRSLATMELLSAPVRRHPQHSFVVQRSVRSTAVIL